MRIEAFENKGIARDSFATSCASPDRAALTASDALQQELEHRLRVWWKAPGVMIEKFAGVRRLFLSEFLDLNHTSRSMGLVSLMIPKFARDAGSEVWRTSESGH